MMNLADRQVVHVTVPINGPTDIMIPSMGQLSFTLEMDDESCLPTCQTCHDPHQRADRHHGPINGPTDIHTRDGWWILPIDTLKTWFSLDEAFTDIPYRYHINLVRFGWSLNRHTLPIPQQLGSVKDEALTGIPYRHHEDLVRSRK